MPCSIMRARLSSAAAVLAAALSLSACGSSGTGSSGTSKAAASSAAGTASLSGPSTSGGTSSAAGTSTGSADQIGFEGVPLEQGPQLAPASTTGTAPVDGIKCAPIEQLAYHIHAHLAVFDDGRLYSLPTGIGIPGSEPIQTQYGPVAAGGRCYYWLHTHTDDGVIHIESPTVRVYSLGDFFDVWHQPLSGDRVASLHGRITALVNGKLWRRSPRAIPLLPHEDIQFDIGEPIPPVMQINWAVTHL